MRLLALLLAFVALPAFGQGLTMTAPGQTSGKVIASLPFATTGCLATGTGGVTIARNSIGTVNANGDGYTLTTCAANEARVEPTGILQEATRINRILQSNNLSTSTAWTSPWAATSGNIAVTTPGVSPVGGNWASATSTGSAVYQSMTGIASTSALACSVFVSAPTGTEGLVMLCACSSGATSNVPTITGCTRSDGGTCTTAIQSTYYAQASAPNIGTTPVRIGMTYTCASATTEARMNLRPTEADGTTSGGPVLLAGAQVEPGTTVSSLIPTTTAAVTRLVDQISATVPAVSGKWCIGGNFTPYFSQAWPNALSLWTLGDTYTVANTASSWANSSLYIVDAASGVKDLGDFAADPVSPFRIVTCSMNGALSAYVNGTLVDDSATGAGTGILSTPATTLRLGAQVNGGTPFNGWIKGVKVCTGATAAKLCR